MATPSLYLLCSNTLESPFFSLSHHPHPLPPQILLAMLSKSMQNLTTSHHLHCYYTCLSIHHLLSGSLQMPANCSHSYSCPAYSSPNTVLPYLRKKAEVFTVARRALQNLHHWEFPGGPVGRTRCFHCHGPGLCGAARKKKVCIIHTH